MSPASDGGAYLGTPNPSKNRQNQRRHYNDVGEAYLAGGNSSNPQRLARDREDARAVSFEEADRKHYYLLELYGPQDDGPQPTRRR